ncbi:MAG: GIY-YIG nuclease family protein [Pseudomonadota bacterium]|nr:GIY-YIG nuclease family protein [Pseudomonadota bacterium]
MITLQSFLNSQTGIFQNAKVKLVRHKDERTEYRDMLKNRDTLLKYQSEQPTDVFKDCDYIISFIGKERRQSILFGIYKVNSVTLNEGLYCYDLEQVSELEHLNDRIVIDWGKAGRSWHQKYSNIKEIIQVYQEGYIGNFTGLLDFTLEYSELQRLTKNPDANRDWYHNLSSVNGIYLILDQETGMQYIGSACGAKGIWGRWENYAKNGHGGNIELKALLETDPRYAQNFRYSILQTLPSNYTAKQVIQYENLYKQKLGSRVHGLNGN